MAKKIFPLLFSAYLTLSPIEVNAGEYLDKAKQSMKSGDYKTARTYLEEELKTSGNANAIIESAKLRVYESFDKPRNTSGFRYYSDLIQKLNNEIADLHGKARLFGYKGDIKEIFLDSHFIAYGRKLTSHGNNIAMNYFSSTRLGQLEGLLEEKLFEESKKNYEQTGHTFDLKPFCYIFWLKFPEKNKYRVFFYGDEFNIAYDLHITNGRISNIVNPPEIHFAKEPRMCK